MSDVRVRVLGPLEAEAQGGPVELSPALRTLVAALCVDHGRVVATDLLLDRLWDGDAGHGAVATLQSYVSRLRRKLEQESEHGWQVLRTQAPGYQLALAGGSVDAELFRELTRSARADPDPATARDTVGRALALWRGPAYADITQSFAVAEADRLHKQLLDAREHAAYLDLALGRHREIVDGLADLVRTEPLHEPLRGHLILALYRSGRQAEALQVYEEGRLLLADSLGVDPGVELRRLHHQVLQQDPALALPRVASSVRTPPPPAPDDAPHFSSAAAPGPGSFRSETAGIGRSALVLSPTSLIGRDEDVAEIVELIRSGVRLMTLTGTGGVGKSRLALAVVEELVPDFADGTVVVPLATLQDPALVLPTIARALALNVAPGTTSLQDIASHLADRRLLIALDNAEHLLDAAPDIARLVTLCPELVVVVTSRAPLRVGGEQERLVAPLTLASDALHVGVSEANASAAVRMFVDRGRLVSRRFVLDENNASAVAEICRRLGGIPLALELAASRLRLFSPEDLLLRLDEALTSGPRDLPERQRTMQATLDWSYRLLDEDAARLFRQLSVFSGGWSLSSLQAVAGAHALGPLETLVEHSLVAVSWSGAEPRYTMLEPIAQHARRLADADEYAQAAAAHAAAYLPLAERAAAGYLVGEQLTWLEVTDFEHANFLAAFEWTLAHNDHDTAGRMVWALWLYWWLRSYTAVGRRACAAVASSPDLSLPVRVRAMTALAALAFGQGDLDTARTVYSEVLDLARTQDDVEAMANSTAGLGIVALATGDMERAESHQREAIKLAGTLGGTGYGPWILALGNVWLGTALLESDRRDAAVEHFHAGLGLARTSGDRLAMHVALWNLSRAEIGRDDDAAHHYLAEGIAASQEVADLANLSYFLDALVVVESRRAEQTPGARSRHANLLGAAAAFREAAGLRAISYYLPDEAARDAAAGAVRDDLGPGAYATEVAAGRALRIDEAVELALRA